MIETLGYLFITSMLLLLIISLIINIFNARRQFRSAELLDRNARYIMNFVLNKVHNVDTIEVNPSNPAEFYFFDYPDQRFNLALEQNNLVFRLVTDTGTGFPDQSTASPHYLNASGTTVTNLVIQPLANNAGQTNKGVQMSFVLSVGTSTDRYGFAQEDFTTFFSIR